jgi:hypothetical protein
MELWAEAEIPFQYRCALKVDKLVGVDSRYFVSIKCCLFEWGRDASTTRSAQNEKRNFIVPVCQQIRREA